MLGNIRPCVKNIHVERAFCRAMHASASRQRTTTGTYVRAGLAETVDSWSDTSNVLLTPKKYADVKSPDTSDAENI